MWKSLFLRDIDHRVGGVDLDDEYINDIDPLVYHVHTITFTFECTWPYRWGVDWVIKMSKMGPYGYISSHDASRIISFCITVVAYSSIAGKIIPSETGMHIAWVIWEDELSSLEFFPLLRTVNTGFFLCCIRSSANLKPEIYNMVIRLPNFPW